MLNVLEHLDRHVDVLAHVHRALAPEAGRGSCAAARATLRRLDEALERRLRYCRDTLIAELESAAFDVVALFDFNRFSVRGWWLHSHILRAKPFARLQLKIRDTAIRIVRRVDRFSW